MQTGEIIVFKDHRHNRYFDASTPEAILRAKYTILKERAAEAWYREPKEFPYSTDQKRMLAMTEEEVEQLPEMFRKIAKACRRSKINRDVDYREEKEWWDGLQTIVSLPIEEAITVIHQEVIYDEDDPQKVLYAHEVNLVEWLTDEHKDYEEEDYYFMNLERP